MESNEVDICKVETPKSLPKEYINYNLDKIRSFDNQIKKLLDDIKESQDLDIYTIQKSKLVLTLTNLRLSLKLSERVSKIIDTQIIIEDRLFSEDIINQASLKELAVYNSINNSRLTDYLNKISSIQNSINIKELENMLLIVTENDNKKAIQGNSGSTNLTHIRDLSLKLIKEIGESTPEFIDSTEDSLTKEVNKNIQSSIKDGTAFST